MADCIFCKIAGGEIDSAKIWEDKEFLEILDIMPNTEGMALVMTKNHFDSYVFDMPEGHYQKFMAASKKVARILEKGLGVARVAMVIEGMGVNHAHIKLYPLHGVRKDFQEMWASEKVFFRKYEGYISTQTGEKVEIGKLKTLAERIRNNQ